MAYPTDLVRTKDWGTEILTDADLEAQLDLIIDWVMAHASEATGHKHDATENEGPKILVSNLNLASAVAGDILYHDGTNLVRLAKGTALQVLIQNSGLTAPEWGLPADLAIASQVVGDLLRFDGTNWVRLADGAANQFLEADGAGALAWVSDVQVEDYGTSASSSTAKNQKALKICYGTVTLSSGDATISNLPFTGNYSVTITRLRSTDVTQSIQLKSKAATSFVIRDQQASNDVVHWQAIGT